ncbi:hypothetical protein N836_10805 [Leptolyngbya sp. Heron Island J]|nr:hypothetical protein N836_10805 [Leptolyngbya sp. Heron Island J]
MRGFERKGADVLIRVAVPGEHAKTDIARTFDNSYEKALPESTAQVLLTAERQNKQEFIDD